MTRPLGVPLAVASRRLLGRVQVPASAGTDWLDSANSRHVGATATAHATPHTVGGWTEIVAATTKPVTMLHVRIDAATLSSGTDSSMLLDVGVGAAASEVAIIPSLAAGYHSVNQYRVYDIPVYIPAGSRVAVRCQSAITLATCAVRMWGDTMPGYEQPAPSCIAIGAVTAASQGTVLTAPGSLNTKGAWTELTASCPQPLRAVVVQTQGASDLALGAAYVVVDIGVGAAGSEVVVVNDVEYLGGSSESLDATQPVTFGVSIPAGARIAARYARAASTANTCDVHLIGIPA